MTRMEERTASPDKRTVEIESIRTTAVIEKLVFEKVLELTDLCINDIPGPQFMAILRAVEIIATSVAQIKTRT